MEIAPGEAAGRSPAMLRRAPAMLRRRWQGLQVGGSNVGEALGRPQFHRVVAMLFMQKNLNVRHLGAVKPPKQFLSLPLRRQCNSTAPCARNMRLTFTRLGH